MARDALPAVADYGHWGRRIYTLKLEVYIGGERGYGDLGSWKTVFQRNTGYVI